MTTQAEVQQIWKNADCICFDVDSTVIQYEGLDELAHFCGVGEEIKSLTSKAMGGALPFRESLSQRLSIVKPSSSQLNKFVTVTLPVLSPGISQLVHMLQAMDRPVYLVSGGFHSIIKPVAILLNIPESNIFANRLLFDEGGDYASFDFDQPTSETGGKIKVAQLLKDRHNYENMVFIGDGVTDMETVPPADAFIGYGGNVVRPAVKEGAHWFVTDLQELTNQLCQ